MRIMWNENIFLQNRTIGKIDFLSFHILFHFIHNVCTEKVKYFSSFCVCTGLRE